MFNNLSNCIASLRLSFDADLLKVSMWVNDTNVHYLKSDANIDILKGLLKQQCE